MQTKKRPQHCHSHTWKTSGPHTGALYVHTRTRASHYLCQVTEVKCPHYPFLNARCCHLLPLSPSPPLPPPRPQNTDCLDLSRVQWLVLDEADQLMEMGFIADINTILEELGKQKESLPGRGRRSVLLSATLNEGMSTSVAFSVFSSKSMHSERHEVCFCAFHVATTAISFHSFSCAATGWSQSPQSAVH